MEQIFHGKYAFIKAPLLIFIIHGIFYFIIVWFGASAWPIKIFRAVISVSAVSSVASLTDNAVDILTSFIFPEKYVLAGKIYRIDLSAKRFRAAQSTTTYPAFPKLAGDKSNPFPGPFANLKLATYYSPQLWALRAFLTQSWAFKLHLSWLLSFNINSIRTSNIIGFGFGIFVVGFHNFYSEHWILHNIQTIGIGYISLMSTSITSFSNTSKLLIVFIFLDIFLVDHRLDFYLPLANGFFEYSN